MHAIYKKEGGARRILSELIEKQEKLLSVLENPLDKMLVKQYIENLKKQLKELQ